MFSTSLLVEYEVKGTELRKVRYSEEPDPAISPWQQENLSMHFHILIFAPVV